MESRQELTLYFAYLIEREQSRGVTLRMLGKRWGVSHAALSVLRKHLRGGARDVEEGIARAETGGSLDELRRRATKWRAKNPNWWPAGYEAPARRNADMPWWADQAATYAAHHRENAWAVAAAGDEPAGREPREDRRGVYVARAVDALLDLSSQEQAGLRRRYADGVPAKPGKSR